MRPYCICLFVVGILLACAPSGDAQPLPPGLVSPTGIVDGSSHTFTWRARPGVTWYQLWISDSAQSPRVAEWYTAAQVGCADGTGMCSVTLALDLADGHASWWVRSYNAAGNGPWSPPMNVFVRRAPGAWSLDLPAALRFQLLFGGTAVLDRETGLVWQRTPSASATSLDNAHFWCAIVAADRGGWRLPTLAELTTLIRTGGLPSGHPFDVTTGVLFWTQTRLGASANFVLAGFGASGSIVIETSAPSASSGGRWCVRGPGDGGV